LKDFLNRQIEDKFADMIIRIKTKVEKHVQMILKIINFKFEMIFIFFRYGDFFSHVLFLIFYKKDYNDVQSPEIDIHLII
jgi:hypothetical protein